MTTDSKNNLDKCREAIENEFYDNWSTTPIAFQDIPYKVTASEWIAVNVLFSSSEAPGIATNGPITDYGSALIEVFVPINVGSSRGLVLGGLVREVLHEKRLASNKLHMLQGTVRRIGVAGDFVKYIVNVPFMYRG